MRCWGLLGSWWSRKLESLNGSGLSLPHGVIPVHRPYPRTFAYFLLIATVKVRDMGFMTIRVTAGRAALGDSLLALQA